MTIGILLILASAVCFVAMFCFAGWARKRVSSPKFMTEGAEDTLDDITNYLFLFKPLSEEYASYRREWFPYQTVLYFMFFLSAVLFGYEIAKLPIYGVMIDWAEQVLEGLWG